VELLTYLRSTHYRHIAVTPLTHARVYKRDPQAWAQHIPDILGWGRPFHADVAGEYLFGLMQAAEIVDAVEMGWRSKVRVASLNDQLFLHSAYPTSEASSVFFGPDTYRFARAVQHYVQTRQPVVSRAVDIGTGSGVGAILLAGLFPSAEVYGVDINPQALALAQANAQANACPQVFMRQSDLLQGVTGKFDLIIANPPYLVDAAQRSYRHGGGALGAELSLRMVEAAMARLTPGGSLILYTGVAMVNGEDPFMAEVKARMRGWSGFSWEYTEIDPDIFGEELDHAPYDIADRIAAVLLTLTREA
jgi:methylase of polypeptide subunit release factors